MSKKKKHKICNTKKIISFFVHHNCFIFNFYIPHCQHFNLFHSGPRYKETFNPSFTHLSDIWKQLLKKVLLLSRFNICKISVKGSYFSKAVGFFLAAFAKINRVTGIFQGFYLDFMRFSIACNISRRLSNGRFRKF